MQKPKMLPFFFAALLLTGCSVQYEYAEPQNYDNTAYTRESAGIRLEDDFYGYENFEFLWNHDIPADMYEYSCGQLVAGQVDEALTNEIRSIAQSNESCPAGSDQQKIRDLYRQYLDTDTRSSIGLAPLEKGLHAIDNAQSTDAFAEVCGMLYTDYGCAVLPVPFYAPDNYDSCQYTVFMRQMELFYSASELVDGKGVAEELQTAIVGILELLEYENADSLAYDAVTMLLAIADSTADVDRMAVAELYNVYTAEELDAQFPHIAAIPESVGTGKAESIVLFDPAQAAQIEAQLTEEQLPVWKALAACALVYMYRKYLPQPYSDALNAGKPCSDEERAVQAVKQLLAGELGNVYAQRYGDAATLSAVRELVNDIRNAYRACIAGSSLLSECDRAACLAKIDGMTICIGFPEESFHSDSVVSGSLLESVISINSELVRENLALAGCTPSPHDWSMTPQTFNALYQARRNSITVPLAVCNAPLFDKDADYFTNLGGLGSVIAHEMGHAFDAEGIFYDAQGNYRPAHISSERTEQLTASVAAYFGKQTIMDTFYIDSKLTVRENAADLGGMQVLASMTAQPEELRRMFESYAKIWATLSYDTEAAVQLTEDAHSPAEIRVNAVLSSVEQFYAAYAINENDGMYVPVSERVRMW